MASGVLQPGAVPGIGEMNYQFCKKVSGFANPSLNLGCNAVQRPLAETLQPLRMSSPCARTDAHACGHAHVCTYVHTYFIRTSVRVHAPVYMKARSSGRSLLAPPPSAVVLYFKTKKGEESEEREGAPQNPPSLPPFISRKTCPSCGWTLARRKRVPVT